MKSIRVDLCDDGTVNVHDQQAILEWCLATKQKLTIMAERTPFNVLGLIAALPGQGVTCGFAEATEPHMDVFDLAEMQDLVAAALEDEESGKPMVAPVKYIKLVDAPPSGE